MAAIRASRRPRRGWPQPPRSWRRPASKTISPGWTSRLSQGFCVDYQGLHGTDERIGLDSIPVVQAVYNQALLTLLNGT